MHRHMDFCPHGNAKLFMRRYTWLHSTMLDTLTSAEGIGWLNVVQSGDDAELKAAGIRFSLRMHMVCYMDILAQNTGYLLPLLKSGVAAFARDIESSKSVWRRKGIL